MGSLRMLRSSELALLGLLPFSTLAGCGQAASTASADLNQGDILRLTANASTVQGTFERQGKLLKFRANSEGGDWAALHLDVHGIPLEIKLDLAEKRLVENAHGSRFELEDRELILALRDAVLAEHPEVVEELHGRMLVKAADRYAKVPVGSPMELKEGSLEQLDMPPSGDG